MRICNNFFLSFYFQHFGYALPVRLFSQIYQLKSLILGEKKMLKL